MAYRVLGDLIIPASNINDFSISGQAKGDILFFNGTNWVVLPASTDGYLLTTHNTGNDPTWEIINSNFGSQNIVTSGSITSPVLDSNTSLSLGTINATSVDIGNVATTTTINGNLTVSGTTTTINSTTVDIADRVIHMNHSTGIVGVPTQITGLGIHRGSTDGITPRDHAGVFWDETAGSWKFAYNTNGNDSTLGSNLPLIASGLTLSGLSTGVVQSDGSGVLSSGALNLAGGASYITGTLPAANQATQTMIGDVTGTTAASVVAKVNGTTYPAGGSLTTGTIPRVTGASTVAYGALDLSNTNAITGQLPDGYQAAQTVGSDLSGTTASATVIKLQGRSVASTAPTDGYVLTWVNANTDWEPKPAASGFTAGGDLSGTSTSQNVIALHSATTSVNVGSATAPTVGQVLTATSSTAATWQTLSTGSGSNAWKDTVRVAATAALPTHTHSSGVLTAISNGALAAQDGITLVANDSILVPFNTDGYENGIYTVTQVGDGSNPWILTRRTDSDATGEILTGTRVSVSEGTSYGKRRWRLNTTGTITIGTTSQDWVLDEPARRVGTSNSLHWACSEGTIDSFVTSTPNIGTAGTATMTVNGSNIYQMGPEGSICGYGCAYSASSGQSGAYYSVGSSIQVHASTVMVSAWIVSRLNSSGNSVITGLYTSNGTVLELGINSTGFPYFSAKIAGGVGIKTAVGTFALAKCQPYFLTGYTSGTAVFLILNGHQVDPSSSGYAANNIDYSGTSPTYTIFNTSTGGGPAGNYFIGTIEEVIYRPYISSTDAIFSNIRNTRRGEARTRVI